MRHHPSRLVLLLAIAMLTSCGGSSNAQRERAQPPAAAPNADIGVDAASRDAALRREGGAAPDR